MLEPLMVNGKSTIINLIGIFHHPPFFFTEEMFICVGLWIHLIIKSLAWEVKINTYTER